MLQYEYKTKSKIMAIQELRSKNFRWIDITNVRDRNCPEIKYLKKNFNPHPINLEDCINNGQRPKIDVYKDHLFLVMLYPIYNRQTGEMIAAEIDFFISKDYIITVHDKKLQSMYRYFNHLSKLKNDREKKEFLSNNIMVILYEILNKQIYHCFPMLDHISIDIHGSERNIFRGKEKDMVGKILASRRNVVNFRKSMQAHKNILKKLEAANKELNFFDPNKADVYFNSLIDKVKEVWDTLEGFKESIEALQETNESLISFKLNQIMKNFTIISVVIFVLTLVATIIGVGANGTPIIGWPFGFWILIGVEIVIAFLVFTFFRKRNWL
ncbi:MAG: magnesium transporter CorA family protein [bacterium]|nr:magnesium transporter CorA family protein [bacterium]